MKIVRRPALLIVAIALAATHGLPASLRAESQSTPPKPNIIVIMADDLGWMDLHCYGNERLDTPALDQLAGEGMRFTNAYAAAPVCSPTRAAMMTGQAPGRLRLTNHAPGHKDGFSLEGSNLQEAESVRNLALSYVTIAERLSEAGYATAHIGKWHLSYVARDNKRDRRSRPPPRQAGLRYQHRRLFPWRSAQLLCAVSHSDSAGKEGG